MRVSLSRAHLLGALLSQAVGLSLTLPLSAHAGGYFMGLGDLPGGYVHSAAFAVSDTGLAVVGVSESQNGTEAFIWRPATGMIGLGDLPGGPFHSSAYGVSSDGTIVVGLSFTDTCACDCGGGHEAFIWDFAGGIRRIDSVSNEFPCGSAAFGVSADGSTIVGDGYGWPLGTPNLPFAFHPTTGLTRLGTLRGDASDVSADGSVVVGKVSVSGSAQAFRWTAETGVVLLGGILATGVSADGSVVVGRLSNEETLPALPEAFRWTEETGIVGLGEPSSAHDVSGDGSVVIGTTSTPGAFIWDPVNGMRNFTDVLTTDFGFDLTGWSSLTPNAISSDGKVVVGTGNGPSTTNSEAWIAVLSSDCEDGVDNDLDGLIDTDDYGCDDAADTSEGGVIGSV